MSELGRDRCWPPPDPLTTGHRGECPQEDPKWQTDVPNRTWVTDRITDIKICLAGRCTYIKIHRVVNIKWIQELLLPTVKRKQGRVGGKRIPHVSLLAGSSRSAERNTGPSVWKDSLRACTLKVWESANAALVVEGVLKGLMSFYPWPNDRQFNN